jgi:16S rRNA U1498 N3-methylase RsmE
LREASLRLRAHDRVGAGDGDGRFLRQEVETESEKHKKKTQIPENEKQIDKTNKTKKGE